MTEAPTAAAPLDLTDYGEAILFAMHAQQQGQARVLIDPADFLALVTEIKRTQEIEAAARALHAFEDFGTGEDLLCPKCSPTEPDEYLRARWRLALALNPGDTTTLAALAGA